MSYKEYLKTCQKMCEYYKKANELLTRYPSEFFFKKMKGYAEVLFTRFAPFREGDRVMLTKTPVITEQEAWGWLRAKHFLVVGAKGTIESVDFYDGQFKAGIEFDDDSWIDSTDGNARKKHMEKGIYTFSEDYLRTI